MRGGYTGTAGQPGVAIGIVVVTYNSAEVIEACLESCAPLPGARVVVIDNASGDATVTIASKFAGITVISNAVNAGFAAAVNQGFARLECDLILLLNPDTVLLTPLDDLAAEFADARVGAAAGRLVDAGGDTQTGFNVRSLPRPVTLVFEVLGLNRIFPGNPVNRAYRCDVSYECSVEQPAGAFLMIRRTAWARLGGFDEGFFPVWFEDVDFCKRLRDAGYAVRFVPAVVARHQGGHSVRRLDGSHRQMFWYGNLLRYAGKHFGPVAARAVALAVAAAALPRLIHGRLTQANSAGPRVYIRVIWVALRCLWAPRIGGSGIQRFGGEPVAQVGTEENRGGARYPSSTTFK